VHPASPARVQLRVNNEPIGEQELGSTPCQWHQVSASWFSGASAAAKLSIIDLNTDLGGNDFALDDVAFGEH
jgi:hypothetical protein